MRTDNEALLGFLNSKIDLLLRKYTRLVPFAFMFTTNHLNTG